MSSSSSATPRVYADAALHHPMSVFSNTSPSSSASSTDGDMISIAVDKVATGEGEGESSQPGDRPRISHSAGGVSTNTSVGAASSSSPSTASLSYPATVAILPPYAQFSQPPPQLNHPHGVALYPAGNASMAAIYSNSHVDDSSQPRRLTPIVGAGTRPDATNGFLQHGGGSALQIIGSGGNGSIRGAVLSERTKYAVRCCLGNLYLFRCYYACVNYPSLYFCSNEDCVCPPPRQSEACNQKVWRFIGFPFSCIFFVFKYLLLNFVFLLQCAPLFVGWAITLGCCFTRCWFCFHQRREVKQTTVQVNSDEYEVYSTVSSDWYFSNASWCADTTKELIHDVPLIAYDDMELAPVGTRVREKRSRQRERQIWNEDLQNDECDQLCCDCDDEIVYRVSEQNIFVKLNMHRIHNGPLAPSR